MRNIKSLPRDAYVAQNGQVILLYKFYQKNSLYFITPHYFLLHTLFIPAFLDKHPSVYKPK